MNRKIRTGIYTLWCIKQIVNENLLIAQGTLLNALGSPKLEGNIKTEGIYVYVWLIHFAMKQKLTSLYKAILQLKKKNKIHKNK